MIDTNKNEPWYKLYNGRSARSMLYLFFLSILWHLLWAYFNNYSYTDITNYASCFIAIVALSVVSNIVYEYKKGGSLKEDNEKF